MDIRTDLIPVHAGNTLPALFLNADAMAKVLSDIEKGALAETADPATEQGRALIKSLAYKVSRSKTALEEVGKELADKARGDWDKINALRKTAKVRLNTLRDTIRQPVNDWEAVEERRGEALQRRLDELNSMALPVNDETAGTIDKIISLVEATLINDTWQEFQEEADEAKTNVLTRLRTRHHAAEQAEAQAAELLTLRAEKLEREAVELELKRETAIAAREKVAADNARRQAVIDAESALEREKDRGKREHDRAQREVAEANLRTENAAKREREIVEAEKEADAAERRQRETSDAHRHDRQETVFQALIRAPVKLNEADATRVVGAISDKLIPFLTIEY